MTTTGLFGTVVAVDNEEVVLEVSPGVETRWTKAAIGRVLTSADAPAAGGATATDDDADGPVEQNGDQDSNTKQS
jgi:preprotein translocase subunit YajC